MKQYAQFAGINGFETAKIIRTRQRNQNTPIIFLTAYSRSENFIFQGYSVGAVDYMLKPIVPEILISKVVVFIELFKKTAEIKQQAERLAESNKFLQRQIKEHQQTEKLLRKREGEFAAIFRAIPDVIIFVNKDGLITIANPAVSTVFGYEAEELIIAETKQPDAILLDVMMPDMDGPTTLKKLQANELTNHIPTIFLTAKAMISEQQQFRNLGVAGIITKPFDALDLIERIRDILLWE